MRRCPLRCVDEASKRNDIEDRPQHWVSKLGERRRNHQEEVPSELCRVLAASASRVAKQKVSRSVRVWRRARRDVHRMVRRRCRARRAVHLGREYVLRLQEPVLDLYDAIEAISHEQVQIDQVTNNCKRQFVMHWIH